MNRIGPFAMLMGLVCLMLPGWPRELASEGAARETVLPVEAFGAVGDGKTDCGPAIRAAIARAKELDAPVRIVFGEGIFRVDAEERPSRLGDAAIVLEGCRRIEFMGRGEQTRILITNPRIGAIKVFRCEGVTVRGFAVDYSPVPFVQGTVVASDKAQGTYDVRLDPGFDGLDARWMKAADGRFGMGVVQGSKDATRYGPIALFAETSRLPDGLWRFRATGTGPHIMWGMEPGARLVYQARRHTQSAFMAVECADVTLADYTVYAAPGLATFWAFNDGITIRALTVKPAAGRLMSSNADGIHAFGNRGRVVVEGCHFEGMGDDAINFHSRAGLIANVDSDRRMRIRGGGVFECRAGDLLQILDPARGVVRAEVEASSVSREGDLFTVELARPVPGMTPGVSFQTADNVYNMSACCGGFLIRRNTFGQHRGRAILLRSVGGTISENLFENTQGSGVVITREGDWPEGPMSQKIVIRDNVFQGLGLGWAPCITVSAERTGKQLAEGRDTRDILVEGNTFRRIRNSAISVRAARDVRILRNRVLGEQGDKLGRKTPVISLDHCEGIVVDALEVEDPDPNTTAVVEVGAEVPPGDRGLVIRGLEARVGPGTAIVLDRRKTP